MILRNMLQVDTLGPCLIRSPLNLSAVPNDEIADFVPDKARVLFQVEHLADEPIDTSLDFEKAGPRESIFFDPKDTKAAIVTCGGLCPGLNHVIRSIVLQLHHHYHVKNIIGYQFGYQGLNPSHGKNPIPLGPEQVRNIHNYGGSLLGVSRGSQDIKTMVDTLQRDNIQILFTVGGDGTLRGASAIYEEIKRRGIKTAVVGVPKTIDNDISYVDKTFGFDTAVGVARQALNGAHTEAASAHNGIGLVKLMGRDSGFITAAATLASLEVNYCLVPEVHFDLEGPHGLLEQLKNRLQNRSHALIVVAEGCAQNMATGPLAHDASGNIQYGSADFDIGLYLKDAITHFFKSQQIPVTLKYIDPSYMIRSVPANANDSVFCDILARQAVHAAMAGKTGLVIGRWHNIVTHVPLTLATSEKKRIDPDGALWLAVTETTGQPDMSSIPLSKRGFASGNKTNQ
ncbi:MAG: ATP-dependent 6-phosphofructokinase [Polyangiaceae bacterium]|nr:ATP-dependent 6-phosphofructokinase [Polyangiaceae bacterium]